MSEQPDSTLTTVRSAAGANALRLASILDLDDIGALLAYIENVTDKPPLVAGCEPRIGRRDLVLAHQEEIEVVGRQGVVERSLDRVARTGRTHQTGRDDDGEVGLVL